MFSPEIAKAFSIAGKELLDWGWLVPPLAFGLIMGIKSVRDAKPSKPKVENKTLG
jgi:hypothetical protein